jgi:hypothetical protein
VTALLPPRAAFRSAPPRWHARSLQWPRLALACSLTQLFAALGACGPTACPAGQHVVSGQCAEEVAQSARDAATASDSGAASDNGAGSDAGGASGGKGGGASGRDGGGTGGSDGAAGSAGSAGAAGTQSPGPCPQGCSAPAAVCDPGSDQCVQCLAKTDCNPGQVCTDQRTCVQCVADDDCQEATAARCDPNANACLGCNQDAHCTRFAATPVCNEASGHCVACTLDTEAARCGTKACALSTGTCTTTDRGTVTACYACQADAECLNGMKCVEQTFGNPAQSVGTFCFLRADSTDHRCANFHPATSRPYSLELATTSVDGTADTYCLPVTTCAAYADVVGGLGPKSCATDSECGAPALADGFCLQSGPAIGKCSYECLSANDCPENGFINCTGAATKHCQP